MNCEVGNDVRVYARLCNDNRQNIRYNGWTKQTETEVSDMNKYVSPDKRSKKEQRAYHAKQRRTWGQLNPVTRSVPSGKTYNRRKEKKRIGREFSDGFDAGSFSIANLLSFAIRMK